MTLKKIDENALYTVEEAIEYGNWFVDQQAEKMRRRLREKRKNNFLMEV